MTSLSKKPAVLAKTARKVRLTASEVGFAKANNIPLEKIAKAKLPKRGRPLGSKNKKKPAAKPKSFKRSVVKKAGEQMQVAQLQKRVQELELIRERLHKFIDRQEHKAIQYQAVIDYLETKLELN